MKATLAKSSQPVRNIKKELFCSDLWLKVLRWWLFCAVCFRWRRCWLCMRWAHPHFTTHRAARRWMVRACSPAWRSSTRWSWRGRRCSDTAKRRDEEDCSAAEDRGDFLNHYLQRALSADLSLTLREFQWVKPEKSLTDKLGCRQPTVAVKSVPNDTTFLFRHDGTPASLGTVSALEHSFFSSSPARKGAETYIIHVQRERQRETCAIHDERSQMQSLQYWRIFVPLLV